MPTRVNETCTIHKNWPLKVVFRVDAGTEWLTCDRCEADRNGQTWKHEYKGGQ